MAWHSGTVEAKIALGILPGIASAVPDIYVNQTGWWNDGGAFNASATRIQAAINAAQWRYSNILQNR